MTLRRLPNGVRLFRESIGKWQGYGSSCPNCPELFKARGQKYYADALRIAKAHTCSTSADSRPTEAD